MEEEERKKAIAEKRQPMEAVDEIEKEQMQLVAWNLYVQCYEFPMAGPSWSPAALHAVKELQHSPAFLLQHAPLFAPAHGWSKQEIITQTSDQITPLRKFLKCHE